MQLGTPDEENYNATPIYNEINVEAAKDINDFYSNPPNFSKNQTFPELIDNELNAEQNNC